MLLKVSKLHTENIPMMKQQFSTIRHITTLLIVGVLLSPSLGLARFKINSNEIQNFISERIDYNCNRFSIPKPLLTGLIKPYIQNGKIKDFHISQFKQDEIVEYIKENQDLGLETSYMDYNHPISKFITFLSVSLVINRSKIKKFMSSNGFEINSQNLWVFSSISHIFGLNTSLELINYYSQMNSPRFLQYMLKDNFIMKKYLCDSRTLWRCFTGSLESVAAIEKKEKMLEFFGTFNYCGVKNYDKNKKTKAPKNALPTG